MNTETFLKTTCPKCSGSIEFPREGVGDKAPCPHCGAEVVLTTSRGTPARAPILIDPRNTTIPVETPGIVLVLQIIAVLQILGSVFVLFNAGIIACMASVVGAMVMAAFAKLIESASESAQRLARLEVFFQSAVNERR